MDQSSKQRNSGRSTFQERDDRLAIWRKGALLRKGGDVCGKSGRHWERRA